MPLSAIFQLYRVTLTGGGLNHRHATSH